MKLSCRQQTKVTDQFPNFCK